MIFRDFENKGVSASRELNSSGAGAAWSEQEKKLKRARNTKVQ